jgi:hypothetical protein
MEASNAYLSHSAYYSARKASFMALASVDGRFSNEAICELEKL